VDKGKAGGQRREAVPYLRKEKRFWRTLPGAILLSPKEEW
jgi:hypothetical protein